MLDLKWHKRHDVVLLLKEIFMIGNGLNVPPNTLKRGNICTVKAFTRA